MRIKLTLKSDAHIGSGSGAYGGVDADIALDGNGLPVIPAKRVKGLLREAGLELANIFREYEAAFSRLFGVAGTDGGELRLFDGKFEDYGDLASEAASGGYGAAEVSELFTSIRTNTAMETGDGLIRQAGDSTLRVRRVADKGLVFVFGMEMPEDGEYIDFITMCCQAVKGVGTGRTRGLGEARCELLREAAASRQPGGAFTPYEACGQACASYVLTLAEPVIITPNDGGSGGADYIPGAAVAGVYAKHWIGAHEGVTPHTDPEFRRVFLEGGVKFLSAYPIDDEGAALYPAPKCLLVNKEGDKARDASVSEPPDEFSKALKGYMSEDYGVLGSVAKTVNAHHARPHDKAIGHTTADPNDGGSFYSCEAIAPGLKFMGAFVGSEEDLRLLAALSKDSMRLGRSKSAQYGQAGFSWRKYEILSGGAVTVEAGEMFRAVLRSPCIVTDGAGTAAASPADLATSLGLSNCAVARAFCSRADIGGYNAKWRLQRPRLAAIDAGSVIVFVNNGGGLTLPAEAFAGLRTGDGFGHIHFERLPKSGKVTLRRGIKQGAARPSPPKARRLDERLTTAKLRARVFMYVNDRIKRRDFTRMNGSQYGRLRTCLSTSADFGSFADKLRARYWKQTDDREAAQRFSLGVSVKRENEDEILTLLKKRTAEVLESDAFGLLTEKERYGWYRTMMAALICAASKQSREEAKEREQ